MISFHNPEFHEKILKKYARRIRRSYFPNLLFKQDIKSPVPGKSHVFLRIKFDFHNTLFWKNLPLSSPEGKQQGNLACPPKLKIPGLKKPGLTPEKPAANKPGQGTPELEKLTQLKLTNPELTACNFTLLKHINSRVTACKLQHASPAPLEPVIPEFVPDNPVPANFEFNAFTLLKPGNPELKTHSFASANSIFANLTSLKLNYLGKNSNVPVSGTGNRIQNKRSFENFFLNTNSALFIHSNPPSLPELTFQMTHHATVFRTHLSTPVLAESGLSRKIHNEALRKIKELNLSAHDFLFGGSFPVKRLSSGTAGPGFSSGIKGQASRSFSPEHPNRTPQSLPEKNFGEIEFRVLSLKTLEQKKSGKEKPVQNELKLEKWIKDELSQNKQSDRTVQVRTDRTEVQREVQKDVNRQLIREKQDLGEIKKKLDQREIKEKLDLRDIREKQSLKETIDSGERPKPSFSNPIQFLIRNFLEKTSFSLYRKYSTDPESIFIAYNIVPEQKTGLFPFSKKGSMQTLLSGGIFPAKGTGTKKTIPERFAKDLFVLRKSHLHENTPGVPGLYTSMGSRLFAFVRSPLSISKNGSPGLGAGSHNFAGSAAAHKKSTGFNRSEMVFPGNSSTIFRQYLQASAKTGTGVLEKIFINSVEKQTRNQQSVPELNSFYKQGKESSGLKEARAFNWLRILTHYTDAASQLKQQAAYIPGSKAVFQLNQQVTRTPGNKEISQPERQEVHKSVNTVFASHNQTAIKAANRVLIHVFNDLAGLPDNDKPTYTTGTYTINSPESGTREKKYPYRKTSHLKIWLRNILKFQAAPISASKAMQEGRDTSYLPEMPVFLAYNSTATHTTGQPAVQVPAGVAARIFNNYVALKPNLTEGYTLNCSTVNATGIKEAYAHMYPTARELSYAKACTFSYTLIHPAILKNSSKITLGTVYPANNNLTNNYPTDNYLANNYPTNNYLKNDYPTTDHYKADNQRELKKEQQYPFLTQYSFRMTRLHTLLNHPVFLKPLTLTAYTFKHPETPFPGNTENSTSNKTAPPASGRKETSTLNPPEKHTLRFASIYTFMQSVARAFNYMETLTHSYPSFIVNYTGNYPINYSASRTHDPGIAAINYPIIYNHTQRTARRPPIFTNNYHNEKRNYPTLPSLTFSFPMTEASTPSPDAGVQKHFRTIYSPSGTDTPAAPSYFRTLGKPHNQDHANRSPSSELSSSKLFSRRPTSSKLSSSELFSSRLISSESPSSKTSSNGHFLSSPASNGVSSSKLFNSSVLLLSRIGNTNPGQKAVPFSLWRSKRTEVYPGIRKLQQTSSGITLSARPKSAVGSRGNGLLSALPLQKISERREDISTGLLFRLKGFPGFGKTANSQPYPMPGNADFTFSGVSGTGKNLGTSGAGAFGKERSELMHAGGSTPETGRQELVYGTSQNLFEEVKQIKEIAFETKKAVADHFESHLPQEAGKTGQVMDIEQMSETVMRMIDRRMKIEAERRGIF